MRRNVRPNAKFFTTEEECDELYNLALLNMTIKDIAGAIGCSYQTISTNDFAAAIVRQGHADYTKKLNAEMHKHAFIDLMTVFPEDRAMYATMKTKMLSELHKAATKDPFVPPVEIERVRRLSDEELKLELEKAIKTTGMRKG